VIRWTDNHCHLDDERVGDAAVEAARAAGVERIITVGTDAQHSARCIDIASRHDGVYATVGLHPHDAVNGVATVRPLFGTHPKIVAVGECGLDYHYDHSPRPVQQQAFEEQVALAHDLRLTLVIHTRDAWEDTFAILDRVGMPERTVFHCFTGGPDEARSCLDRGAFLSFSGIVTFPRAPELREAAALCPMDRLLVETDAPYLAPVPHRGRTNQPAYVTVVGAAIAAVKGLDVTDVAEATWHTASVAFGLPQA
jgi:TatD DNase family protein